MSLRRRFEPNLKMSQQKKEDSSGGSIDKDVETIFQLMVQRSHGGASNEDIEKAVSSLLQVNSNITQPEQQKSKNSPKKESAKIAHDEDDYDNIPETNPQQLKKRKPNEPVKWSAPSVTLEELQKADPQNPKNADPLSQIPMGKVGARMMVTFGDGPNPDPEAVRAALHGARRSIQMAIKDARACRRHTRAAFMKAKQVIEIKKRRIHYEAQQVSNTGETPDAASLFRAMGSHDKLGKDINCGFDVEQLQSLFPEEMLSYRRWSVMQEQAETNNEKVNMKGGDSDDDGKGSDENDGLDEEEGVFSEGRLKERAANFDVRTDNMKGDSYLKFAEVRQGSFLPRKSGRRSDLDKEWEKNRKAARSSSNESWHQFSLKHIRFLHWVGFDPRSGLPPPSSDETIEVLAFLGYDFMGRIVEKVCCSELHNFVEQPTKSLTGVWYDERPSNYASKTVSAIPATSNLKPVSN